MTNDFARDMLDTILTELANIQDLPVVRQTVYAVLSAQVDIKGTGMVATNVYETLVWCNYTLMGGGVYQAKNGDLVIVTSLPGLVRLMAIPHAKPEKGIRVKLTSATGLDDGVAVR